MDHGNRTKIALAGVALLALGAGAYWIGFGRSEAPAPPAESTVALAPEPTDQPVAEPAPKKSGRDRRDARPVTPPRDKERRIRTPGSDDGKRGQRPKTRPRGDERREKDIPPAG